SIALGRLRWTSKGSRKVLAKRNTGLWPVRRADILSAFFCSAAECDSAGRTEWKVCVPVATHTNAFERAMVGPRSAEPKALLIRRAVIPGFSEANRRSPVHDHPS